MGNLFQGYREGGQDWNTYQFDTLTDQTPSGVAGVVSLDYGINVINFSGVGGRNVAVVPSGSEMNNPFIYIKNLNSATWTISGANTAQTFDGSATTTIAQNASLHLYNYSGTAWVKL